MWAKIRLDSYLEYQIKDKFSEANIVGIEINARLIATEKPYNKNGNCFILLLNHYKKKVRLMRP